MNQPPPVRDPLGSVEGSRFAGVEMALRRDALARAIWSAGGLARAIATRAWETFVVGALTATSITTGTLDATTSIETVDLTVTGTATLPGGGGTVYSVSSSVQSLTANGQTITIPADTTVVRISATGAYTGILIDDGTTDGQLLILVLTSGTTISLDTSVVATSTTVVVQGGASQSFIWLDATSKWHPESEFT